MSKPRFSKATVQAQLEELLKARKEEYKTLTNREWDLDHGYAQIPQPNKLGWFVGGKITQLIWLLNNLDL